MVIGKVFDTIALTASVMTARCGIDSIVVWKLHKDSRQCFAEFVECFFLKYIEAEANSWIIYISLNVLWVHLWFILWI